MRIIHIVAVVTLPVHLLACGRTVTEETHGAGGDGGSDSSSSLSVESSSHSTVGSVSSVSSSSSTMSGSFCNSVYADMGGGPFDGWCLHQPLPIEGDGKVSCAVIDFFDAAAGGCACDVTKARTEVSPAHQALLATAEMQRQKFTASPVACTCEIKEVDSANNAACASGNITTTDPDAIGFCYVTGSQVLSLTSCTDPELIHLAGTGALVPNEMLVVLCGDTQCND